ncbi:MAG TPA: FmdB family zinc ribbon protein [Nitriliruptorales bacterium]
MPTYEYACADCGEHLEVVQSFKDDPLVECPACSGRLNKVFSAAGIIFKGSGWHIKDYAGKDTGSAASGSSSSSTKGESSSSSSKDSGTASPKESSGSSSTTTSGDSSSAA